MDREDIKMPKYQPVRLGEIIRTNQDTYSSDENWEFVNYLDTGNITANKIEQIKHINLKSDKLPSRARRKVRFNSIVYSTVRPNQLHYGIIKEQPDNFLVSTGFVVIDVIKNRAIPDYIYYLLTQKEFINFLQTIAEHSTSTYPSFKASDIENLPVLIPDMTTQEKVVNVLLTIDKKIQINIAINQ